MGNIICNPLNLEYRYQLQQRNEKWQLSREGADPTVLLFGDTYLLFVSMSGGFWYSDDLVNWNFKETPELPIYDYAPDVHIVDGKVVWSGSNIMKAMLYVSEDPLHVPFRPAKKATGKWWDPTIFQDDDGRVYFYQGSSTNPIEGVELDRVTLKPLGKPVKLGGSDAQNRGWERVGENNVAPPKVKPKTLMEKWISLYVKEGAFIEGAFMNKYKGKYYLQYAAPGTEYNVYGDGVYVSDHPLGPFTYQRHNPFSSVPGGFMTSAGHGSTFLDKNGRWWHAATMLIGANEKFERRVGLFPCDFDKEGILHCDQALADYPFDVNTGEKTGWMLLNGSMTASSAQTGFEAEKANDENVRTWWAAENSDENPWLQMDLGECKRICGVQVNFADHQVPVPAGEENTVRKSILGTRKIYVSGKKTAYLLEGSADGESWVVLQDRREGDFCHDFICLPEPMQLRYLRLKHMEMPFGAVPAVSGLRVFGVGNGEKPSQVGTVWVKKPGDLNICLRWEPAEGAVRYNVRYGIEPKKLYNSWQVSEPNLNLSFINKGESYYAAVDAINENGMTPGKIIRILTVEVER